MDIRDGKTFIGNAGSDKKGNTKELFKNFERECEELAKYKFSFKMLTWFLYGLLVEFLVIYCLTRMVVECKYMALASIIDVYIMIIILVCWHIYMRKHRDLYISEKIYSSRYEQCMKLFNQLKENPESDQEVIRKADLIQKDLKKNKEAFKKKGMFLIYFLATFTYIICCIGFIKDCF